MRTRFSVIIPAYNEAAYLPRLIASIKNAALNFRDGDVEIIVADNSSTDDTARIARDAGCRVATVKKRAIAAARNGGASIATGEVFCFIDADSALHPDTFNKIDAAMRDPTIIAGATGIYLERWSPALFVVYWVMMPIAWLTGFDTGVVFCRREDFQAVGGYNEDLLLAEDVDFLIALKRRGRQSGQRLTRLNGVKALGSTRKFDTHGDWHYFTMLPQIVRSVFRHGFKIVLENGKMPPLTDYWYKPDR
jgi:glycosyltransferase involved in cell wall biosynthesis